MGVVIVMGSRSGLFFLGSGGEVASSEAPRGRAGEVPWGDHQAPPGSCREAGQVRLPCGPGSLCRQWHGSACRWGCWAALPGPVVCMKACGPFPRLDRQTQATTLVHQIFGGYLRSRGEWRRVLDPLSRQGLGRSWEMLESGPGRGPSLGWPMGLEPGR